MKASNWRYKILVKLPAIVSEAFASIVAALALESIFINVSLRPLFPTAVYKVSVKAPAVASKRIVLSVVKAVSVVVTVRELPLEVNQDVL